VCAYLHTFLIIRKSFPGNIIFLYETPFSDCYWKREERPGAVAHACNPSYSGGRNEENCSSRIAQAKS
jgi:hypothetical protein